MGTAKRERQKANRQLRLEELAKQARKEKSKRFGFRIALGIAAVVALVGAIYLLGGGDDDKSVSAATTTTITRGNVYQTENRRHHDSTLRRCNQMTIRAMQEEKGARR